MVLVLEEIDRSIEAKDGEGIERCVTYVETYDLHPSREDLISLLDRLAASGVCTRRVFDQVVQLARSSPF